MHCVIVLSMNRVLIYCRVSTLSQSNKLQAEELSRFAEARGWSDRVVIEDVGTGTNTSREGFEKLMSLAKRRKIDTVLIWKLDRLFRSLKDLVVTVNEFEDLGISLISLKDQIDLITSTGKLMVHLLGAFAQFEADLIKSRVLAGLEKARREGKRLGRPRHNKEVEIRKLRERGMSYQQIQMRLKVSKGAVWRAIKCCPKNPAESPVLNVGNREGLDD